MSEKLQENTHLHEIIDWTKSSLSLLEKETRIWFFKKASDRIKNLFWIDWNSSSWWTNLHEQKEWTSSKLKVKETRDYISNWWTFYSPSRWICQRNKYRHVCSTGSFNVLRRLGLPKVSNSTEVDLQWDTLTQMWLKYIGKVNPKNPWENGYKPQDWDTAVRPKFKLNSWKTTQHQATYINWHWVSDNIQKRMSCYPWQRNEPDCKIYRYMW
jgi:hypothetical protein